MKFMKLGSKPDAFQADGKTTRYVSSELATDVIINVGEVRFYLHKFPLLSKSGHLQKLVSQANDENSEEINLVDFPGGPKVFEICAKFCYGITVTLNPYNVVAACCAAEYLKMTEDIDRGNLTYKIKVFLKSSVFRSWKDSIIVLQTTKSLLPWSEDLKINGNCIDAIASKISIEPTKVTWSYTYNRKLSEPNKIIKDNETKFRERIETVPKDWWVEDICELEIDYYRRVMIAVKSKGNLDGAVIGEALKTYAVRWLPDSVYAVVSDAHTKRNRSLVETIICLLPSEKNIGCSCSFLLKLLKVAILVGADELSREDLVKRVSMKLQEASVRDLLIPAQSPKITKFDVDLVSSIVNQYMLHEKPNGDLEAIERNGKGSESFLLGHGSLLKVGKLVDEYLAEIAYDPNVTLPSFMDLSQLIPESARPIHDGLYKAVDVYMKEHTSLTKAERKKICGPINVKKLTVEASMHAAQNEQLPLRVVVQVLFFEQIRASARFQARNNHSSDSSHAIANTKEEYEKLASESCNSLRQHLSQLTVKEDLMNNRKLVKNGKNSGSVHLQSSRSRRIFDKLWVVGKGHVENKSSGTSGSPQSPSPASMVPGDTKSSASSSRHRRHSIS